MPFKCLPSLKANVQNLAERQSGTNKTPVIAFKDALRIVRNANEVGGAAKAHSPAQSWAKASTPPDPLSLDLE